MSLRLNSLAFSLLIAILFSYPVAGAPATRTLANPASTYCVHSGGTLQIQKRGDGGEYGICFFEDNRQCEEWALFRGECPLKGLKITGYTTPAAVYCVIQGGKINGSQSDCVLPNKKSCHVNALYDGRC